MDNEKQETPEEKELRTALIGVAVYAESVMDLANTALELDAISLVNFKSFVDSLEKELTNVKKALDNEAATAMEVRSDQLSAETKAFIRSIGGKI